MVPLAEIAPGLTHPELKKTVAELLAGVEGREGVERREWRDQALRSGRKKSHV
jgi:7,8-dihydro-6-hydroxymethylpterin-pyrophosphokinase